MKRIWILTILSGMLCAAGSAQTEVDALRLGRYNHSGSARFTAMGGAFSALGGDMSALHFNPAGVAVFSQTEFAASLGLSNTTVRGEYSQLSPGEYTGKVTLPAAGYVSMSTPQDADWKAVGVGISLSRMADFNATTVYRGVAPAGRTLADALAASANGVYFDDLFDLRPFGGYLGFESYVIDFADTTGFNYWATNPGPEGQNITIDESGSTNEIQLSVGGNYKNKLYIGLAAGIVFSDYRLQELYRIDDADQEGDVPIERYTYQFELNASGVGANLKLGAIYRVNPKLRVGAYIHTRTGFTMNDNFSSSIRSTIRPGHFFTNDSSNTSITSASAGVSGVMEYRTVTPSRQGFSVAYVSPELGILSAEVSHINYRNTRFKNTLDEEGIEIENFDFSESNENLDRSLENAWNYSVGLEKPVTRRLLVRAGLRYLKSGINAASTGNRTGDTFFYSGGLGFRMGRVYVDYGFSYAARDVDYPLYSNAPESSAKHSRLDMMLTFGVRY